MTDSLSFVLTITTSVFTAAHVHAVQQPVQVLPGPEAEAWFGSTVDWAKDGNDRFIVGAPVSDTMGSQRTGQAFVYEAGSSEPVFVFEGEANGDRFGSSVAGLGDLTGDGYGEWLVGAPGSDANGDDAGRAYLFSGKSGQLMEIFTGIAADGWFGFSVAHVGDINGDGVMDFAVGARQPSGNGYVYVYSGADFALLHEVIGEQAQIHFGFGIAGAGDVNGDGFADFAVSAPFHGAGGFFRGRVYVYSGLTGAVLHTFSGEADFNYFGTGLAIAGDVNNDDYADIVIGADGYSLPGGGGPTVGRVYVYSGQDGSLLHQITGDEDRGRLGRGVSAIGDVNSDGHADLLVGRPAPAIFGGTGNGRAFVFSGATGEIICEFIATEHDDFFGHAVRGHPAAGANQPNVLIGAFASNANGFQSGRADLFVCGESILGDLNGDGVVNVSDLLILFGAWGPCDMAYCPADLNHDDVVDVSDLLILFGNWG